MSTAKKIAHNTIYQVLGKIVTMSIAILVTTIITRAYGVEGYGIYSLIIGFPALFYIITDFGLNAIATRELAVNEDRVNHFLGTVVYLRTLLAVLMMFIAGVLVMLLPYSMDVKIGITIALFTILTTALYSSANIGFQIRLRYDLSNIANAFGTTLVPVLVLLMIYYKLSIIYSALANVFASIVTVALMFLFLRRLHIFPKVNSDSKVVKPLLKNALPLGLMFIFSQINFKADSVLLSFLPLPANLGLNNIESVGMYGLPYKVFEVSLIIPTFFMNSVYPVMVRHYAQSKKKLLETFKKVILVLIVAGILCAIFGYLLSDVVIYFLGGNDFLMSSSVLKIFLVSSLVFYLTQPFAWLIVTLDGQKYLPYIYLVAAVFNLVANYIMIPRFSFFASANITWISELIILLLLILTAQKVLSSKR